MLILFDLDDTLVYANKLMPNYEKIVELKQLMVKHGFDFGVSTSRPYLDSVQYLSALGIKNNIFCETGNHFKDTDSSNQNQDETPKAIADLLNNFFFKRNIKFKQSQSKLVNKYEFFINPNRLYSATIYLNGADNLLVQDLSLFLQTEIPKCIKSFTIGKIIISSKSGITKISIQGSKNKFSTLQGLYPNKKIVIISDKESGFDVKYGIDIAAVVNAENEFKSLAQYGTSLSGVEGIIDLLLSIWNTALNETSELIKYNNEYFLLEWNETKQTPNEIKVLQVSGFIFSNKLLLLVKVSNIWTIPGGKPELGESNYDTLRREAKEEAGAEITNITYLGYLKITNLRSSETFAQERFKAYLTSEVFSELSSESSEARLVELEKIHEFVSWYDGKSFKNQLLSAIKTN
jgi:8-oxo-dGTP pyrophosphatase MutT (NUDIX family)